MRRGTNVCGRLYLPLRAATRSSSAYVFLWLAPQESYPLFSSEVDGVGVLFLGATNKVQKYLSAYCVDVPQPASGSSLSLAQQLAGIIQASSHEPRLCRCSQIRRACSGLIRVSQGKTAQQPTENIEEHGDLECPNCAAGARDTTVWPHTYQPILFPTTCFNADGCPYGGLKSSLANTS